MKWRLTGRYLMSVVLVVILVILINIFTILLLLIVQVTLNVPIFQAKESTPAETFTRSFQEHIMASNDEIAISEKGKKELISNKAWIQILDENGKEVYGYRIPVGIKKKYTPLEVVNSHKYVEADTSSTVFISGKKINNKKYSYFIGFKNPYIEKIIFSYDSRNILHKIKVGSIVLLLIDSFIALLIGYFFSKRLTHPLQTLISGIIRLANKDYNVLYEPKGIYKDVFYNVNSLSNQLKENEKERKKIDLLKEEWISNISHDIKTPLASIQGYAEMMKDQEYHFSLEEMREFAEIIEKKSLYMKELIEDLNITTRLKNKELALNTKTINIVTLLRNTVIDILNDARYSNRNIKFQVQNEIINIEVDEILIRRAFNNLIYNAIVHNDSKVNIVVSIESKERTHITIMDDGKGIKKEDLNRIFDRYYRGTNTGESHKGSGLGMAIAKDIIQAHNGEISISSVIDHGTKIEIEL
ncbi:HAMP domain-containing sensor histidine kinase [Peribacillus alkalitolerans]|uniref:HAMP domain-containing sensor histidine kinase n=1 Tax=Peribacillus alkalitolerans TaxID=1550385 RepID=UPI0013CFAE0A|nr:HAMP domain-containing sensor histidine kinase [Peribacillus alkalitolerans]